MLSDGLHLVREQVPGAELIMIGDKIHADAAKYGAVVSCTAVAVYGGASKDAQVRALQRGCELIIGTPGRIKDVLDEQRTADVAASLRYVAAWNSAFLPSRDLKEGISAMFAKREPNFTGE